MKDYLNFLNMLNSSSTKYHVYETRINETNFKVVSVTSSIFPYSSMEFRFFNDTGDLYEVF